jgi:riboflavin synthase
LFTGLIETVGKVISIQAGDQSKVIAIDALTPKFNVKIGDSVAINGVCLTIEKMVDNKLFFRAVFETINTTTLGTLKSGSSVNLERAMLAGGRLDGHIVQGHVDTTAKLVEIKPAGDSIYYRFKPTGNFMKYIAPKGSVAIDGISLTIAESNIDNFTVALIPHTVNNTSLKGKFTGDIVNIECDVLARYIEQLIKSPEQAADSQKDANLMSLLERNGF